MESAKTRENLSITGKTAVEPSALVSAQDKTVAMPSMIPVVIDDLKDERTEVREEEKKKTVADTEKFGVGFEELDKFETGWFKKYVHYQEDYKEDSVPVSTGFSINYNCDFNVLDIREAIRIAREKAFASTTPELRTYWLGNASKLIKELISGNCSELIEGILNVSEENLKIEIALSPEDQIKRDKVTKEEYGILSIKFYDKKLGRRNQNEFVVNIHIKAGSAPGNDMFRGTRERTGIYTITKRIIDRREERAKAIKNVSFDLYACERYIVKGFPAPVPGNSKGGSNFYERARMLLSDFRARSVSDHKVVRTMTRTDRHSVYPASRGSDYGRGDRDSRGGIPFEDKSVVSGRGFSTALITNALPGMARSISSLPPPTLAHTFSPMPIPLKQESQSNKRPRDGDAELRVVRPKVGVPAKTGSTVPDANPSLADPSRITGLRR